MRRLIYLSFVFLIIFSSCKLKDAAVNPTTPEDLTLSITYPNGGDILSAGSSFQIKWSGTTTSSVRIQYSIDNGTTWSLIVDSLANTGVYTWFPIPNNISDQCRVRIATVNGITSAQSAKTFSIVSSKILKIDYPVGKESWEAGSAQQIRWYSIKVDSVKIEYTTNNGQLWNMIGVDKKNTGVYYWAHVPNTPSTLAKIKISDAKDQTIYTTSPDPFTILPEPILQLTSPKGGEKLYAGTVKEIDWHSENIEKVKIEFTTDNGANWNFIDSTASIGFYSWSIPTQIKSQPINSQNCKIKISDAKDGQPFAVTDSVFTITNQGTKSIKVTSPKGGEVWPAGTTQNITWDATGISNVKIEYTINNGNNWNTITVTTPSTGFYTWAQIPGTPSTNCKVRISDVLDGSLSASSDAFFTIGPAASIKILVPNGNDTWISGTNNEIKWTSENIANVKIEYTSNAGGTWNTIVNSTPSSGSFTWQNIPDANNSLQCRVRISEAIYGAPSVISADNFAIMRPGAQQIKVVSPNGGEKWNVGSQQNIIWDAGGIANIKIEYTINNGLNWTTLIASTPSNGYYTWNPIPNTPATNCKVRLSDASDGDPSAISSNTFSILPAPSIKVVSPNGGETIQYGAPTEIQWTSENIQNVKIEYTTNGGADWNLIINSVESIGTYVWTTVPNTYSQQCRIRISDALNGSSSDISDNNFIITNVLVKSVKVLSPNGGENWEAGTKQNITWNSSGIANVKIELSTDKGASWGVLVDNYAGSAFEWNVGEGLNSTSCQIRVSDATDHNVSDISDAVFTISPRKFITVTGPQTAVYKSSEPVTITWVSGGIKMVGIRYTTTNGIADPSNPAFTELATVGAGVGSYSAYFALPSEKYFVQVYNADEGSKGLPSNNSPNFTIVSFTPTVTVISPNGGEQWLGNDPNAPVNDPQKYHPFEIKWHADNVSKVKIEWTTNGGGNWYVVPGADSTENDGSYMWAPGRLDSPVTPDSSDNCKIRITSADKSGTKITDATDGYFSIHKSKKIQVVFPNNGEDFYKSDQDRYIMGITWTSYAVKTVNIYISLDNGVTWAPIAADANNVSSLNYPSTGLYIWNYPFDPVTGPYSNNGRIKIVDVDDNTILDINDVPFLLNRKKPAGSIVPGSNSGIIIQKVK